MEIGETGFGIILAGMEKYMMKKSAILLLWNYL
jgi:hypothetical protein